MEQERKSYFRYFAAAIFIVVVAGCVYGVVLTMRDGARLNAKLKHDQQMVANAGAVPTTSAIEPLDFTSTGTTGEFGATDPEANKKAMREQLIASSPSLQRAVKIDPGISINHYPRQIPHFHWQVIGAGNPTCRLGGYGPTPEKAAADCLRHLEGPDPNFGNAEHY